MKKTIFSLPILAFLFISCSENKDYEPEPPLIIETPVIATLQNADGTYYTLHNECIRLRKADGTIIAEHETGFPEPMSVQLPYGEQTFYSFGLKDFYTTNDKVVLTYVADDRYSTSPIEDGYSIAYLYSKDLKNFEEKKYTHGQNFRLDNFETVVITYRSQLYSYNADFKEIAKYDSPIKNIITRSDSKIACSKSNGKYYIFREYADYIAGSDALIANYSDGTTSNVYMPYESTIHQDFFADETYFPRLDSKEYSFEDNKFHITYHYTKYNGEKADAVYQYDLEGNQVYPEHKPERIYIEATNLSNIIPSTNAPSELGNLEDGSYILIYPTVGIMTVNAKKEIYDRTLEIEFDVASSDNSILEISKSNSRSYNGTTTFKLMPRQQGRVDIVFTSFEYGVIEAWEMLISEVK